MNLSKKRVSVFALQPIAEIPEPESMSWKIIVPARVMVDCLRPEQWNKIDPAILDVQSVEVRRYKIRDKENSYEIWCLQDWLPDLVFEMIESAVKPLRNRVAELEEENDYLLKKLVAAQKRLSELE